MRNIIDFIIGMCLFVKHIFCILFLGNNINYTRVSNTGVFISDRPFGSMWLTRHSNVWIVRTRRGIKLILDYNSDIINDDMFIRNCDAKPIRMTRETL